MGVTAHGLLVSVLVCSMTCLAAADPFLAARPTPKSEVGPPGGNLTEVPAEDGNWTEVPAEDGNFRNLTEVPAEDGKFSDIGPFDEEPDDSEAEHPRPAIASWEDLSAAAESSWWGSSSFCQTHHVGFFCQKTTRTRCCRSGFDYKECGSTVHSTSCGWHGVPNHPFQPGYPGGSHPGWHAWSPPGGYDQFCEEHHVGNFCGHHTSISCCRTGWHYRSCTSTTRSHSYC